MYGNRKKLVFALITFSQSVNAGNWAIDCTTGLGKVDFIAHDKATMVVNSNQIVISSTIDRSDSRLTFFYAEPEDLGRGGMMLPWSDFSREKKIAFAKQVDGNRMLLTWKGFFDTTERKYIWSQDSDYVLYANKQEAWLTNCVED
ncbi:hypothetical protein RE428_02910 [Marinobacter nanhaiticus D15-8W]|uniref:Uncharacterized protein n=1 Tax=Marinobacter nanhaiticus D15-8W TaxID=626887 RepID=N6WVF9_9GAMM|nr:hypothetical protein [Marinobacter nanhaiticus]ENO15027.1 hypothetical protein J057_06751 [Marinobacter nanhaiticus D15-8W]BES69273.1 hypothetical protein RE428_02910 [Marinobacter nanhaiticus D15-8W]